ncbi:MAG: methylenetetrahydrofolate reductase [NAD(P)H] [Lachnospiraceae bacterium]|nr:methylenetetrahydrofolate reductase [NAD(P)H] [Lachnospiraceae bacterium]
MNKTHKTILSLEVFPPKKEDEFQNAFSTMDKFKELNPSFISVTYGAGGSRSKKTVEIADYIQNTLGITALAHLTCVGNKKEDIDDVCSQLQAAGIKNILALRGDRPADMSDEQYEGRDFAYAAELVSHLKQNTDFTVFGACYPEKHFEAMSTRADLQHLKQKVEAGCSELITQLFMNNDVFYDFCDKALAAGITIPIHAGIMPITSVKQVATTISLSGTSIPKAFSDLVARYGENPEDMRKAGIDYAIRQMQDLIDGGVEGIHIYSMNKPKMTAEIVHSLRF